MLNLAPATQIFLVRGPTDMRKSFNGLMAIVTNDLKADILSGHLFVFSNRSRNRIKIIFWDRSGLWVCAKRLEKGTFAWPEVSGDSVELSSAELALLLGGLDLKQTKRRNWYSQKASSKS